MSKIWSFHGGIHPPENKQQSLQRPLEALPLPSRLVLPLQQHIGAPASPLVKVGDRVLKGQPIAEPTGFVSAYLHAPTSGTVVDLVDHSVPHPSGMTAPCVVIEPDGEERWIELQGVDDYRSLEKHELAERIRHAGIAGMGGAGFPTEIKLHLSDDHIINTLIINGVECEPYITADDMLMRERADEIIGGIEIAAHLLTPTHVLMGIEDNKPEAARAMTEAARRSRIDIEVVVVPTKYPSGGERQLVKLLTGVEVPSGKIPADIGIVVQNVGTLAAVYNAVHFGKPLISRITTITGEAASRPGNREVLIGTPISDLLAHAGVDPNRLTRLVMGGPMMGYALGNANVPLIKTSNCIIAGAADEFPPAPPAQNCIRCGACEQVCPAELLPQQLHWFAKGREYDKALNFNLLDCIECGACSYVCPSNIPLVQYYRHAKGEIRREQAEQRKAEQARIRFEARNERLEREKTEKEARRKARAEAAAKAQAAKKDDAVTSAPKADPEAALKAAKTAAAVARTKLKKAEKALQIARDSGESDLAALEAEVSAQQQKVAASEAALKAAESTAPAKTPDIKELKLAAATARTKVTKTEKALADAEAKALPSAEKLRSSLATLRSKADAAQHALAAAEQSARPAAPAEATAAATADLKQLKSNAAILRTKLKKARKAIEAGDSSAELAQQVTELEPQLASAEQALAAAQAQQPPHTGPDLKALKSAVAIARTKVKKAQKALDEAGDNDDLRAELAQLQQQAAAADAALEAAQQATESP
ncbi:electron transport complex subunit RsxC [Motiliproteus sediminis]|uniref:electron transport complex subunit RsxC n=1 Tax=Motiliproteus sediminis TaxID=1468178 RepID=UPI001AEF9224|nr:electron transport complex subunit RsxC [Motiliproteus sediminis]